MIAIGVVHVGANELQLACSRAETVVRDLRPEFELIGDQLFLTVRKTIDRQGYTPLTPEYAVQKLKKFGSKPILRASDAMYNSFSRGNANSVVRVRPLSAEYGSADPLALFHNEGAGRLPKRVVMDITGEDEVRFARVAADSLKERLNAAGLKFS